VCWRRGPACARKWAADQPLLNPEKLVFIDETGITTKMARLRGRAPMGERCIAAIPHGHWMTTTFTAGLRLGKLSAPTQSKNSSQPNVKISSPKQDISQSDHILL
jgi:hypothetical protein